MLAFRKLSEKPSVTTYFDPPISKLETLLTCTSNTNINIQVSTTTDGDVLGWSEGQVIQSLDGSFATNPGYRRGFNDLVKIEDLAMYRSYSGNGAILQLDVLESVVQGAGVGRNVIEQLQSEHYELIEGIAVDDGAAAFLEHMGFWIHSLHEPQEFDHFMEAPEPVYLAVWHNSKDESK